MKKKKHVKNGARDASGRRRRSQIGTLYTKKAGGLYFAKFPVSREKVGETFETLPSGEIRALPKYKYHYIVKSTGTHDYDTALSFLKRCTADLALQNEAVFVDRILQKRDAITFNRLKHEEEQKKLDAEEQANEPGMSIIEAFEYYQDSTKRPDSGKRTLADYEGQYGKFIDWIHKTHPDVKEVRQVSADIAEEFSKHLRATVASGTHNHYIIFLRSFWRTIMRIPFAKVGTNPWDGIRNMVSDCVVKRMFTVEQMERFIPRLPDEYKMLTALAVYSGSRLEDCALAKFEDYDLVTNVHHLIPAKTRRIHKLETYIPIHPVLKALLLRTPAVQRTGYIVPEIASRYLKEPSIVTNRFQKALREAGIETSVKCATGQKRRAVYGFHSVRHFVNTWLLDHGASSILVAKLLVHSYQKEAMTLRYYHENLVPLTTAINTLPVIQALNAPNTVVPPSAQPSLVDQFKALLSKMSPNEIHTVSNMVNPPVEAEVVA